MAKNFKMISVSWDSLQASKLTFNARTSYSDDPISRMWYFNILKVP